MFIKAKYVLQFARRDDLQNNGFDPVIENRRFIWTCSFVGSISAALSCLVYPPREERLDA